MRSATSRRTYAWRADPKRLKVKPDWAFSFIWAGATCLGGTFSWTLALIWTILNLGRETPSGEVISADIMSTTGLWRFGCIFCLTFGFLIGLAQVLVLRKRLGWTGGRSVGWLVTSVPSYLVVFFLSVAFLSQGGPIYFRILAVIVAGLLLSWAQWVTLHSFVQGIRTWMAANIAGTLLGGTAVVLVGKILNRIGIVSSSSSSLDWEPYVNSIAAVATGLFVYGLITGIALNKMERDTAAHA
jgi:hypothetical protein